MVDPAAFAPNQALENRLGSRVRDALSGSAEMQSPAMGADFTPKNGRVKINFRGTAPADASTVQYPSALKIYANRSAANAPLHRLLPTIDNRRNATQQWTFFSAQQLRLRPGLYYFILERREDEAIIFTGKFTVGARQ